MTAPSPPRTPPAEPEYGALDHYADEQGRAYFEWQLQHGDREARYNGHLWAPHVHGDHDVLDFGCGGGLLLQALPAARKVGVEINPHAREHARTLGIEVHPTLADVAGTFDRVISSHALEHVPHPLQALREMAAKLRDERSRLLLLLPLDDWRAASNRRFTGQDVNMHLHTWTPQLLGNLIEAAPLRVEEIRVVHHAWPPLRERLWHVSPALVHAAAAAWARLKRQRQLFAIAAPA